MLLFLGWGVVVEYFRKPMNSLLRKTHTCTPSLHTHTQIFMVPSGSQCMARDPKFIKVNYGRGGAVRGECTPRGCIRDSLK